LRAAAAAVALAVAAAAVLASPVGAAAAHEQHNAAGAGRQVLSTEANIGGSEQLTAAASITGSSGSGGGSSGYWQLPPAPAMQLGASSSMAGITSITTDEDTAQASVGQAVGKNAQALGKQQACPHVPAPLQDRTVHVALLCAHVAPAVLQQAAPA